MDDSEQDTVVREVLEDIIGQIVANIEGCGEVVRVVQDMIMLLEE
jgi:DNA phosphorothioation-dependent restriction protein DptG